MSVCLSRALRSRASSSSSGGGARWVDRFSRTFFYRISPSSSSLSSCLTCFPHAHRPRQDEKRRRRYGYIGSCVREGEGQRERESGKISTRCTFCGGLQQRRRRRREFFRLFGGSCALFMQGAMRVNGSIRARARPRLSRRMREFRSARRVFFRSTYIYYMAPRSEMDRYRWDFVISR